MGYIHTMDLAMKMNEPLMHSARIWLHFKSIMLNKIKQTQETKYFMISFILHGKGKLC